MFRGSFARLAARVAARRTASGRAQNIASRNARRMMCNEAAKFGKRPNLGMFFGSAAAGGVIGYFLYNQFNKGNTAAATSAASGPKGAPKIIISGAPGSGKGTQCENIVRKFGVVHISTGDILREHVKGGTDLGKQAKEFMSKGELVPDELVISMVKAKLSEPEVQKKGWLLDGFPRTPAQAQALAAAGVTADVFLQLEVPDEVLVERICGRRTDPVTGKIYHLKFNPPPSDPAVQARLVHRADDTEEALRTRLVAYHNNVNGILDFYKDISVTVNGHSNGGFKENVTRVQRELFQGINNSRFGAPHIIISGAPGSGKGTQCENIVKQFGVVHISTGDILREHVKGGTDLGKQAKAFMEKGELVPDQLVIDMVKAKLSETEVQKKGWLLDGFPRTPAQAEAMAAAGISANVFLQLEVPDEVLVERICGRRTDPVTGKIYHLKFNPPPSDPAVINRLQHRKDDTEEALRTRLVAYHNNVNGILDFYKDISVTVNGHGNAGFKENVTRVERELLAGINNSRFGAPHIIISGAPGSGKGTQCENIVKQYNVVHISTGDILREHVKGGTDLGKQAKEFMSKGELVPDQLVIDMVKTKLAEPEVKSKGWLLDGFPRTPAQAEAMAAAGISANVFLQLEVPDEVLVERICGRRTDPVTGKIYHLKFNPPPADATVQGRLVHRADDTEEALRTRLVAYHKNVNGILDFYKDISVTVNGHSNGGFKENVARVQREIEDGIDQSRQH